MFTTVWTAEKIEYLRQHFHNCSNASIVAATGVSERTIQRKAKALGLVKDPDYIAQIARDGLLEIDYLRLIGRKMGPPKGLRCNPKGEFRKGHRNLLLPGCVALPRFVRLVMPSASGSRKACPARQNGE